MMFHRTSSGPASPSGHRSAENAAPSPTPWMTQPCGELLPDDVMIVADMGRHPNGIQRISTVARVLSIRQTKEVTAANAAFIVKAVNNHDALMLALEECCHMAGAYTSEADAIDWLQSIEAFSRKALLKVEASEVSDDR